MNKKGKSGKDIRRTYCKLELIVLEHFEVGTVSAVDVKKRDHSLL